jgi:NADH:ubiquinone oxidoreductase subunit 6 (subunit J)
MFDISSFSKLVGHSGIAFAIILVAALVIAIFWLYQFVQMMLLEDRWFPGRFDKPLWVAVFVLVFPLAPFAFLMWKAGYRAEKTTTDTHDQKP